MKNNELISVVIPVFNEEKSLKILYEQLQISLKQYPDYEIIFVDDGSSDNSFSVIEKIAQNDKNVIGIRLLKNFGKSDALNVGFKYSTGNIVITMDADLQDDPLEIRKLVEKIRDGWDLVSGWKKNRKDPFSKKFPSMIFNYITRLLTGVAIHDFNCGLKAYKRIVVETIDIYGGMHRYIPVLANYKGFSVSEVIVNHRSREYGLSKYGIKRFLHGFFDIFTVLFLGKYVYRPLHFFGFIGLSFIISGIIICSYLTIGWFQGIWIGNRPILFLGMLLIIMGVQIFSIGLLAELFIKNSIVSIKKIRSVTRLNPS